MPLDESAVISRYGWAVAFVAAALAVGLAFDPLLSWQYQFLILALAPAAATRMAGRASGMAATALSVLCGVFFILEPRYSLSITSLADAGAVALLAGSGVAASLLTRRRRPARRLTRTARRLALLGAVFAALLGLTNLLYSDVESASKRQRELSDAYRFLGELRAFSSALEEAETTQRGYILTGDEHYFVDFEAAYRRLEAARQRLGQLGALDRKTSTQLEELGSLAMQRANRLRNSANVLRTQGLAAALAVIRPAIGDAMMKRCRALSGEMEQRWNAKIEARRAAYKAQTIATHWALGLGAGTLIILLVIASAVIEREFHTHEVDQIELSAAAERLRLTLESAGAGTWEWNLSTNQSVWSDGVWRLYDLEPRSKPACYETWRDAVHPDDRARAEAAVQEAVRTEGEVNFEFRVATRDGSESWMLSRARLLPAPAGQPGPLYFGIVLDITQRKKEEDLLAERVRNLRSFAEAAPVAIAMFDRDMNYLAASKRYREDFHLGAQEITGRNHYEVFPEILERWREVHRRCLEGAVERHDGEPFVRQDGSMQWVRWEVQPWRRTDGEIGGIVLFTEDITPQTQAIQALRENRAKLHAALASMTEGVFISDADGRFIDINDAFATFHRFASKDECPKSYAEFTELLDIRYPDGSLRAHEDWSVPSALRGESSTGAEFLLTRKDTGETWWGSYSFSPIRDASGAVAGAVVVASDITERKRAEDQIRQLNAELEQRVRDRTAQLEAANQELESFAYSVSHDLRAPLRGIDGFSAALVEDYGAQLDEEAQGFLRRIRDDVTRMRLLIEDLLRLSRITTSDMRRAPVDLSAIAGDVAARLRDELPGRNLDFVIEPGLISSGDERLLGVVFTNLMGNAAKFTAPRELARIEVGRVDSRGEQVFYVRDNGVGFDATYAHKLFGAFQRLHPASEFPGTGIGLATVQRVIRRHGGRVWAESELGRGASFYFTTGD